MPKGCGADSGICQFGYGETSLGFDGYNGDMKGFKAIENCIKRRPVQAELGRLQNSSSSSTSNEDYEWKSKEKKGRKPFLVDPTHGPLEYKFTIQICKERRNSDKLSSIPEERTKKGFQEETCTEIADKPMTEEELKEWEQDRELERSLQSGKMTNEELIQDLLKLCGWFDPADEVLPPGYSDGSQGGWSITSDDEDEDEGLPSFITSAKGTSTQKMTERAPSLSAPFADLRLSSHPYKKKEGFVRQKSTLMRTKSIYSSSQETHMSADSGFTYSQGSKGFMSASPFLSSQDDMSSFSQGSSGCGSYPLDKVEMLEDAFHGIMHEDNNGSSECHAGTFSTDEEMAHEDVFPSSQNFWDEVEF